MTLAQTSLDAFHAPGAAAAREDHRVRILRALLDGPATARALGSRSGVGEHEATRRCSELVKAGLVVIVGMERNVETGRAARLLAITPSGAEAAGQKNRRTHPPNCRWNAPSGA